MPDYVVGQRWMSQTEPELGLGTVAQVGGSTVDILFPATGELRQYAVESAPLQRVRFRPGDQVQDHEHRPFTVREVHEEGGLLTYRSAERALPEAHLSDTLSVNTPQARFLHGQVDEPRVFDLRLCALRQAHRLRQAPWRGFAGGRISLIPHQLYIAREVAGRLAPRVLLADEVGLGKTIEACLIAHRLLLTGRVRRVLIVVPEPLMHQWFVELRRRFNLTFSLFDEERCAAIEEHQTGANPFLDDQLILASLQFLTVEDRRAAQAVAAGWDLVIIDEAHHLHWSPEQASPEYNLVEALARETEGLLLLTATPEQLGEAGHFARLRLLDPDRYHDLGKFLEEAGHYQKLARVVDKLGHPLTRADEQTLLKLYPEERQELRGRLEALPRGRDELIEDLLDRHGPGRVMFRNTRAAMKGFPKRELHPARLPAPAQPDAWNDEPASQPSGAPVAPLDYSKDPRLPWLVDLLRSLGDEKVLLICRTPTQVAAIEDALRQKINVKTGLFHENMTLLQRDRSAAWFAEPDGARLLLCSEIGSEGRNFQFAHQLVLFDLPVDPNLLEQRIGRLDRIGQSSTIHIHVPYRAGTGGELLFRWFHDGLNAFEQSLAGGTEVLQRFGTRLTELLATEDPSGPQAGRLIDETRSYHRELAKRLAAGRDHLLELASFRAPIARDLVEQITAADQDTGLDDFMLEMFDHFGVRVEELSPRTFLLGGGDLVTEAFPALPAEGLVATADRAKALAREEIQFLSWDHPLVTGALDLLLSSQTGTASYALCESDGPPSLFLEAVFVLECPAPEALHADEFLPPTPVRVTIDHRMQPQEPCFGRLKAGPVHQLLSQPELGRSLLPQMLEAAQTEGQSQAAAIIKASEHAARESLGHELSRLRALRRVNPNVRQEELDALSERLNALLRHLAAARLRLDGLRLIRKG